MNEIKEKIEKLEKAIFYLSMKDRWNSRDYDDNYKMHRELEALRKKMEDAQ